MRALILLCAVGVALAVEVCHDNAHYESCGTACPLTCSNYDDPPKACVLMCVPGCVCDEGYVKSFDGTCVKPENCQALHKSIDPEPYCPENAHYEQCGTSCPLTCKNHQDPPQMCNLMCNSGCFCDEGYVQTYDLKCVKPEHCPAREPSCPTNSHYELCGTSCPLTCENYEDAPLACNFMCNHGCFCDKGYVETHDGKCVKPEHCPARDPPYCPDNAHYEESGTSCPLTCENYQDPPLVCDFVGNSGCFCDKGYVKTHDGKCVKPEHCPARDPPSCPTNSHYEQCGTSCPLTCENYEDAPLVCDFMCNHGCFCDEGYVEAHDGKCVKPEHCPARDPPYCSENSHYLECGTACPLTCDNYDNPPKICPAMCVSGCHCVEGFVKTDDGHCVRPENCPARAVRPEVPSCFGEPEKGRCRAHIPMYYYDIKDGTCKQFIYGGCDGNGNRHVTEKECMALCEGVTQRTTDICSLPKEQGLCDAYFLRYHYDSDLGKCVRFVYGGCGGNENNFQTEEECELACKTDALMAFDVSDCRLFPETGPCKGDFVRYYYDKNEKTCKPFVYGGCEGNRNNFETKEDCNSKCAA